MFNISVDLYNKDNVEKLNELTLTKESKENMWI